MNPHNQLYQSNTTRTYPLEEGEYDVSNDVLVDMSLSLPSDVDPVVTAIAITPVSFFMAVEDRATKTSLGYVSQAYPQAYAFMPLRGFSSISGWVVCGPGISDNLNLHGVEYGVDPSVVLRSSPRPDAISSISVNGVAYPAQAVLKMLSGSEALSIGRETRIVSGVSRDCLVFGRVDSSLGSSAVYNGLAQSTALVANGVRTIAGARPSDVGDISIELVGGDFTISAIKRRDDTAIGLLLEQGSDVCSTSDPRGKVLHGRCEQGISSEDGLPLDPLVEELHPEFSEEDCGCQEEP